MKFFFARMLAIPLIAASLAVLLCVAQNSPSAPVPKPTTAPAKPQAGQSGTTSQPNQSGQGSGGSGQVIFSRSIDANGETTTKTGPAAPKPSIQMADAPSVEDADRQAISFTDFDMDVRLHTAAQQLAVRALVTVRNTGKTPLARIPLQISSSLNWERIRVGGRDISFPVATLNSDADHTGQLHEAAVPLAQPLQPGATVQIEVTYSGTIAASAQRLIAVGTPEDAALHSDWDQISAPFTGLRGFGNVAWYPVSSVPVILGDGARLFDEIGTQKLRLSGAHFQLRLTVEFPHGEPPTIALVNGLPVKLAVGDPSTPSLDVSGIATGATETTTLGSDALSLFVAVRSAHPGANLTAFTAPEDEVAVKTWLAAAADVTPLLQRWLGQQPRTQLTLLDLPDPDDAPWESGPLLAIGLHDARPEELGSILAHALTHAWRGPNSSLASTPVPTWLSEGTANFMGALWVERKQGRDHALATLEAGRAALALAEPASPGDGPGQPLIRAISPVYYRTKAAYVLWMLRDLVGDDALAAALGELNTGQAGRNVNSAGSAAGSTPLRQLLEKAAPRRDLSWFFADWVDADKGLPDLSIEKVFPNAVQSGNWLVSVTISNAGYAAAEIPVMVRSATNTTAERVLVPAHGNVTRRLLLQGKPTEAQVNDGTVPETQASVHVLKLDQTLAGAPASGKPSSSEPSPSPDSTSQPPPPQ
jgi:hypothetical protein